MQILSSLVCFLQRFISASGGTRLSTPNCHLAPTVKHTGQESRIRRWIMWTFQMLIISAVKICTVKTDSASGELHLPEPERALSLDPILSPRLPTGAGLCPWTQLGNFVPVWFLLTKTKTKMVKNEKITKSLTKTKTKTKRWWKLKPN